MMKLKITLFFLLAYSITVFSQGWTRYFADSVSRNYTFAFRMYDVVQTVDNGYFAVGTADYASNMLYDKAITIKVNAEGRTTVKQMKVFGSKQLRLVKTTNQQIFAYTDYYYPSLVKFAPNGDVLWQKDLKPFSNFRLDVVKPSNDGNLFVMGRVVNQNVFCKVNTSGDTIWRRNLPIASSYPYSSFTEDVNGDILFVGGTVVDGDEFLKLNAAGNVLVGPLVMTTGTRQFGNVQGLKRLPNGTFQYIYNDFRIGGYFRTCTKDGQFISSNYLSPDIFTENNLLIPTSDDAYLTVKPDNSIQTFYKIRQKQDSTQIIWTKKHLTSDLNSQSSGLFQIVETRDKGFIASGFNFIGDPEQFKRGLLMKFDSLGDIYSKTINGRVALDINNDCKIQATDLTRKNMLIKADGGNTEKVFFTTTNAAGNYEIAVDTGKYKMSFVGAENRIVSCFPDSVIDFPNTALRTFNMPLKAAQFCAKAEVTIGTPLLRRCFDNTYRIDYCSKGTLPIRNGYIDVTLDTALIFQSSTLPFTVQGNRTYRLRYDSLDIFECRTAFLVARVTCDTPSVLGRTLCVQAHIYPDSACNVWQNARIVTNAVCNTDSVRLSIQNIGQAATTAPINYTIIADDIVISRGQTNLNPNAKRIFAYAANGRTYRIQANQELNAPFSPTTTAVVEACGRNTMGGVSTGFVNAFDNDDKDSFLDIDCQVVRGAYDPNDKQGFPTGYGSKKMIEQNQDIEYMIRFQNTGTDTAFTVVLRDTLSPYFDVETVEFGGSSHAYSVDVIDKKVLTFTFNNIFLVDSFTNLAKSMGFVKFKIKQKKDVPLGTKINNSAGIYFDFNAPIITNQTMHTVGKNFILSAVVDKSFDNKTLVKIYPNPFSHEATFEIENGHFTEGGHFELYDAVGHQLRREKINGNQFVFQREALMSGFYFFRILDGNKFVASGKIIIE